MSKAWPRVKLGKVLHQYKEYIDAPKPREYKKLSVKLYGKGVVLDSPADGSMLKMKRHQIAKAGQVILSEIWGKKGAIGFVPDDGKGALCTSHFFLFDVCKDGLEPRWLQAIFDADYLANQLGSEAFGTTGYAAVRPKTLLACEIPLPPLSQQRRIVARIEELAAKITEARSLRQQAAEEAIMVKQRIAEDVFDKLTSDYPNRCLEEVVTIRGGGTPSKAMPYYWEGSIPWVTPKDMKVRQIHDAIDHISELAIQETSVKMISPGAVLVVVRGMILAHTFPSAVLNVSATINQDMKALSTSKEILPEFLCALFWAYNPRILERVAKSTHDTRKFQTAKLLSLEIPVPPLPEQRRIVAELDVLQDKVDALKRLQAETAAELDALLPSILDRAFKGEL
jgi:type I restriction enzyme, S subunit